MLVVEKQRIESWVQRPDSNRRSERMKLLSWATTLLYNVVQDERLELSLAAWKAAVLIH